MKILKEAKEKLPVSFLTDFVSRGWDDVGYLKETIKSIGENFSGTKKVEELLTALLDAYLVCIGQMELHLKDKDYLEFPDEDKLNESKVTLAEDVSINIGSEDIKITDNSGEVVGIIPNPAEETPVAEPVEATIEAPKDELPATHDEFEFFVDFDEPTKDAPMTDNEIAELRKTL